MRVTSMNRIQLPAAALALALVIAAAACSTDPEFAKQEYLKSGDRYVAEQKYNEAVVQYRNAMQQDARFGEARLKLAQTYEKLNDPRNAFREYVRAADLLPDNVEAQVKAATFLLAARQFEDAKARAVKGAREGPEERRRPGHSGQRARRSEELRRTRLTSSKKRSGWTRNSAVAYASLGAAQASSGSKQEAEAAFRKAVETNPNLSARTPRAGQFPLVVRSRERGRVVAAQGGGTGPEELAGTSCAGDVLHRHPPARRGRAAPEKPGRGRRQRIGDGQARPCRLLPGDESS